MQADVIDETMADFLHRYLATNGAGHEIELADAIEELPTSDAAVYYASQIVD